MASKSWRWVSWPALTAMLASPLLIDCGKGGGIPGVGTLPGMPAACPNLDDPSAVANASFGLKGELEGKVKASLTAAAQLKALSAQIEGDVVTACSGLAKDLGASDADLKPAKDGPGAKAEHACNVAVKFLGQAKAEAKAAGKMEVVVVEPKCNASLQAAAECAGSCDVGATGGKAEVKCEGGKLSGKCDAECSGQCSVKAGAQCGGTCSAECSGKCEGNFSGKCDGTCDGTCDGKNAKGKCAGKCDGKCSAGGSGTCSGKCQGTCSGGCDVDVKGKCEGTCTGGCSVEFKEPKCSGKVEMPKVSVECKAKCDAELAAKVECTPARVKVMFAGDTKAGAKLATALEKNLPLLLKVAVGMKGRAEGAVGSVKASVEGLQGVVSGGGDAAIKVGACVGAALKAQADAALSINVSVKASVSASASAKGSAG